MKKKLVTGKLGLEKIKIAELGNLRSIIGGKTDISDATGPGTSRPTQPTNLNDCDTNKD
ncbi:hypothetical protein U6A24_18865 [Aquimarina gracilis]|uniref:Natural product n=1 Tax=Aquimarina gracilis TaxID=874422 RepID=A0ABU6A069_9FLAO|nr:hypothetical protein [Aquimarina gracilis]MEB3347545.1 hypothetical protein [Aquimarina gracilis]